MKNNRIVFSLLLVTAILFGSCRVYHDSNGNRIPPGQAKKIYGTKSAKPFAPGQQKKHH
jgi:hypothetical protein